MSKEIPDKLIRFLKDAGNDINHVQLAAQLSKSKYQTCFSEYVQAGATAESIAKLLVPAARKNLRDNKKHDGTFRVTVQFPNRRTRSTHFIIEPSPDNRPLVVKSDCPDCKGTGVYIGLRERYSCPTCKSK